MIVPIGTSLWTWLGLAAGALVLLNVLLVVVLALLARSQANDDERA
ncbi:MAG: hypothetical protein KatS3mg012_1230 [Gaiellaceae bacterium]|jgi:tetrahydromethanopterin S-methyltransferase subunit F|nr:MAG: hypothetical protein KatS3mg012_1230 [Gaiellaceae bacterium]